MIGKDIVVKGLLSSDFDPVNDIMIGHSKVVATSPSHTRVDVAPVSNKQEKVVPDMNSNAVRTKGNSHLLVEVF